MAADAYPYLCAAREMDISRLGRIPAGCNNEADRVQKFSPIFCCNTFQSCKSPREVRKTLVPNHSNDSQTKMGAIKANKVKIGCILEVFKASCGAMMLEGINVMNIAPKTRIMMPI
jgi:hypothetical protein